ncbi:MAG: peptide-methionine (S)-S-oxide reductase MsrA [Bacilli bacterium]
MKSIYFAGGCFWGVEKYLGMISGVVETEVGYAQSDILNPTYADLCEGRSSASEVVRVKYNENIVTLNKIIELFFKIIDPTSINKQGADRGIQYRTGIYYTEEEQKNIAVEFIDSIKDSFDKEIVVEVEELRNYTVAEDYHQKYLEKNINGYCHINFANFSEEDFN